MSAVDHDALLALAGDVGCAGGPTVVEMVSGALDNNLKLGILAGAVFPVCLLIGIYWCRIFSKTQKN